MRSLVIGSYCASLNDELIAWHALCSKYGMCLFVCKYMLLFSESCVHEGLSCWHVLLTDMLSSFSTSSHIHLPTLVNYLYKSFSNLPALVNNSNCITSFVSDTCSKGPIQAPRLYFAVIRLIDSGSVWIVYLLTCFFLSYLVPYSFTNLRVGLFRYQARGHKSRPNMALVFCGILYFITDACLVFCFVRFSFSVRSQEIGWEECLLNDLFCVGWDVKP